MPINKPLFSERIHDGDILIKIEMPDKWVYKKRYIWEQHYGVIPKDYVIKCIDGDKTNLDIENLVCIHKKVNSCLNLYCKDVTDIQILKNYINIFELIRIRQEIAIKNNLCNKSGVLKMDQKNYDKNYYPKRKEMREKKKNEKLCVV